MNGQERQRLRDKRRIVIKIGSSSLTHQETGDLNLFKMEQLVRIICDLKGAGREVVLVSSGAIAAGRQALNCKKKPGELAQKQAFAAVGQARLMMVYQKLFAEYNQVAAQELLALKTVPIVNENDTVSTSEIPLVDNFGDNDRLSAVVAALIGADLLILLSDIDGLYTDDPRKNRDAKFISLVPEITGELLEMGKAEAGSDVGTGGMAAKLAAARIATDGGADMVIADAKQVEVLHRIMDGEEAGTLFLAHRNVDFDLMHYLNNEY